MSSVEMLITSSTTGSCIFHHSPLARLFIMLGPSVPLRRRLHSLTGFHCPPLDSWAVRVGALAAVCRATGDETGALRLEAAFREARAELRAVVSREEARELESDLSALFLRLASSILNVQFSKDNFWRSMATLLDDLYKARVADAEEDRADDELDQRIEKWLEATPLLTFPSAQVQDEDTSLLNAVLTDQRGLKVSDPFAVRASQLYDRRYCAVLRARLFAAEQKAKVADARLRVLEGAMDRILNQATDLESLFSTCREALINATQLDYKDLDRSSAEVKRDLHRRLAATLRDLSEELRVLPDRLNAGQSVKRNVPPTWLVRTLRLARLAAFDATSIGLLQGNDA